MLWLRIPSGTPWVVKASALCMISPRSCAALLLPIGPRPRVLTCVPYEKNTVSCMTSTTPPQPAMRAAVAFLCGFKILAGLALGLLNSRYAACVPAHVPHASLIGELGDWARYIPRFSSSDDPDVCRRGRHKPTLVSPTRPTLCRLSSSPARQGLRNASTFARRPLGPRRTPRRLSHYAISARVSALSLGASNGQRKSPKMCAIERVLSTKG